MADFDTTITKGICSICGKPFKNKSKIIYIALDLADNKLKCKECALDEVWDKCKMEQEG